MAVAVGLGEFTQAVNQTKSKHQVIDRLADFIFIPTLFLMNAYCLIKNIRYIRYQNLIRLNEPCAVLK